MKTKNKAWNHLFKGVKNPQEIDVIWAMEFIYFRFKWVILDYFKPKFKLDGKKPRFIDQPIFIGLKKISQFQNEISFKAAIKI